MQQSRQWTTRLLVLCERRNPGERLEAAPTLVPFHLRVGLKVGPQVGAVGEGSVAMEAGEGFLSCGRKPELLVIADRPLP